MSQEPEHFIKNIEIKNFKCFEDFKAEGFGRVNLIGGKNNVGKTAFMEACRTNVYATNIGWFILALVKNKNTRELLNYYNEYRQHSKTSFLERFITNPLKTISKLKIKSNIRDVSFNPVTENGIIHYECKLDSNKFKYLPNEHILAPQGNENILSISTYGLSNYDIIRSYANLQELDKENFLNDSLSFIDSSITNFKIIKEIPYCKIYDKYVELAELGDGIQQFISIVVTLFKAKDGYLFIDEIGNGIHYTNLDKLWEIILTISKEQNVQVFATTHSKECIESYARVAKKLGDEEITMTVLARNLNNEIKALVYDDKMFYSELEQNHEVRGW